METALRIFILLAANAAGLLCVVWPVLPKGWGVQQFVGRVFGASDDPSMGIQYMFFWLMTVPLGAAISFGGTKFATKSSVVATLVAALLVFGSVKVMFWIHDSR